MSTAAYEAIGKVAPRIKELRTLANAARAARNDGHEDIHNAICRSCAVLIASHIEGCIKDIVNSVRLDLNFYLKEFKLLPTALKREFCKKIAHYEGVKAGEIEARIKQLISFFERNSVPVELDAFPYLENVNKNPKPSSIDAPFEKFGVNGALGAIGSNFLLGIFSESAASHFRVRREMVRLKSILYSFPYKNPRGAVFAGGNGQKRQRGDNLWHTFLEEIVTRRHKIAHGDSLENPTTIEELDHDIAKSEVMIYSLAFFFCSKVGALVQN